MRSVKILRLVLENFKCHRFLELNFAGGNVTVYGDNATGKTSVYDALTWLLFGKDSAGNGEKNIEVKPLDSAGAVIDHSAITSVEAELLVEGEVTSFKRTYKEVWSTRRGSSVEVFSGNTSEYYVDGVPHQKNAFDEKIKAIVSEDVFRLLTSVSYFPNGLAWQKRREILFDMAGTLTDRDIMATDERFLPLLDGMGKLTLDDYKRKLAAERRGFVNAKTEIPARISECQKTIEDLQGLDFATARATIDALSARRDEITAQLVANENDTAISAKRLDAREIGVELGKLEAENKAFRASQVTGTGEVELLQRAIASLNMSITRNDAMLQSAEQTLARHDTAIEESRARWIAVNSEIFTGGSCPTCGQQLPMEQLQMAVSNFEVQKQKRLREIADSGESQKKARAEALSHIDKLKATAQSLRTDLEQTHAQLAAAEKAIVVPTDMDGYAEKRNELHQRLSEVNAEIQSLTQNAAAVNAQLAEELTSVREAISAQMVICGKESAYQYAQGRIEELRQDAKNAAACLEAVEKMIFLIDEYARYKTTFVEDSINSLFRIARFRLYREQANGGVEDRCDVVFDGVPYISLNNGMKINVGIDIINALSRHHGVSVPLFVDNAESVTELEKSDAQVIRLVVSGSDKKLRCVNES